MPAQGDRMKTAESNRVSRSPAAAHACSPSPPLLPGFRQRLFPVSQPRGGGATRPRQQPPGPRGAAACAFGGAFVALTTGLESGWGQREATSAVNGVKFAIARVFITFEAPAF